MYVRDGALEESVALWRENLGSKATILTKAEVVSEGLFGPHTSSESFDRMGDFIAIAHEEMILIDPSRVAQESAMVGHHGGVTDSERVIPLLKFL